MVLLHNNTTMTLFQQQKRPVELCFSKHKSKYGVRNSITKVVVSHHFSFSCMAIYYVPLKVQWYCETIFLPHFLTHTILRNTIRITM